jgi:hypothetical protein
MLVKQISKLQNTVYSTLYLGNNNKLQNTVHSTLYLGNNSKNSIEAVMLILKLLFVFLSTKGNAKKNRREGVKILLSRLLFLAAASSAVGVLIMSHYFVTYSSVCTTRTFPTSL